MQRLTGSRQIRQDVSLLLSQRRHGRQHALGETQPALALRAKTSLAPQHRSPQRSLSRIVGRLNALVVDECPQRDLQLEDIATGLGRLAVVNKGANLQQRTHFAADRSHRLLKRRPRQGAVPHAIPQVEHLGRLRQQLLPNDGRFPIALDKSLEIVSLYPLYWNSRNLCENFLAL